MDVRTVDDVVAFDDSDDRSRDIVVALCVEARHFRRLSADEDHVVFAAGLGHAHDDAVHHGRFEASHCHVVEEKQRARALDQNVVAAVVHDILSRKRVRSHFDIDLELCPDSIDGTHENRVLEAEMIEREKTSEVSDIAQDALVERGTDGLFHADHRLVRARKGNTCVCIIHTFFLLLFYFL